MRDRDRPRDTHPRSVGAACRQRRRADGHSVHAGRTAGRGAGRPAILPLQAIDETKRFVEENAARELTKPR
jgi:hypothetical protein